MKNINVITLNDAMQKHGCKSILFVKEIASKLGKDSCTWFELLQEVGNSFLHKAYFLKEAREVVFTIENWWWLLTEVMELNEVDFNVWIDFILNPDNMLINLTQASLDYLIDHGDWDDAYTDIDPVENPSKAFQLAKDFSIYLNELAQQAA